MPRAPMPACRRRISRWCRGRRPRGSARRSIGRVEANFSASVPSPTHRIGARNVTVQGAERRMPGFARYGAGRCRQTADAIAKPPGGTCGGSRRTRSAGKAHLGGRDRKGGPPSTESQRAAAHGRPGRAGAAPTTALRCSPSSPGGVTTYRNIGPSHRSTHVQRANVSALGDAG
jgi:hypothetical protein